MTINYKNFNDTFIENIHGRIYFYRDLYEGNHSELFPRAQKLIEKGELVDNIFSKQMEVPFVQTPYIVANVSKLIIDVPAMLVSRSIGKIDTGYGKDQDQIDRSNAETYNAIEGAADSGPINSEILNLQQELIRQIVLNSKMEQEHWGNVVQHQLDGGLVGVPWDGDRGLRVEFKARDVYFPHDDDMGADLSYSREFNDLNYLHIYRERIMRKGEKAKPVQEQSMVQLEKPFVAPADGLRATHTLVLLGKGGVVEDEPLSPEETAELLNMRVDELDRFYPNRNRLFIRYWANEKTFMNPLGVSALKNQEGKQDEINWTLTRNAMVFERNGKPRLAINKELAAALQKQMVRLYGESAKGKFDNRQLEVVSMDDKGKSIEIIQIDVSKIGDVQWVKDLLKLMLMETKTSEKAIDFYMSNDGGAAQSGVAKFYDLFISLIKAEMIQTEYIAFLKGLIEDALWLANQDDPAVLIEQPEIKLGVMIPVERRELIDVNLALFKDKAQSLETTLREIHKTASEDWILEEMARLEAERTAASDDSSTLTTGRATLESLLDNPNSRPVDSVEDE